MQSIFIYTLLLFSVSFANSIVVDVIKPKLKNVIIYYSTVGQIKADTFVYLKPEVNGRITQINVEEGDRVKKGQILARIERDNYQYQYESQMYNVKKLQEIYSYKKSLYEKKQFLYKKGLISEDDFLRAKNNMKIALNELLSAQQRLKELKKRLKETDIKSPINGILDRKYVNPGDLVTQTTKLFYIIDPSSLKATFYLPQRFFNKLKLKEKVLLYIEGFGITEGKISYISYSLSRDNLLKIKADLKKELKNLKDGLFIKVKVREKELKAFILPEKAVFMKGSDTYVLKVVNGITKKVKVKIVEQKPGYLIVKGNLSDKDLIVVSAPFGIKENEKVKIGRVL